MAQVQVDYYTYSGLLDTTKFVILELYRIWWERQSLVLKLRGDWNRVWSMLEEGGKSVDVKWYVI